MEIDCGRCEMRGTGCRDCVITALRQAGPAGFPAAASGHLGEAEVAALGVLAAAGMVPPLRLSLPGPAVPARPRAWTQRVFPDARAS